MKKVLSTVLSTAMLLSLAGCSSKETGKYTAGTYTGSGKGHSSATFSTSEITKVELDVSGETESIGGAASEELQKQIMEKQSSDIDGVSGATETSNAVKAALEDAIAQASGSENKEKTALKDGTYEESAASFGVMGLMKGEVTIKDNKITDIKITEESDSLTAQWFQVAESKLIPRIIEAQSVL